MKAKKLFYYLEMLSKLKVKSIPKIVNYLKYKLHHKYELVPLGIYTPQIGSLFLTKRCNLSCEYCSAANTMTEGRGNWREQEATLERVKKVLESPLFKNCLLIDLVGGEPLLVKELEQIVRYLSDNGHLVNMPTNGIGLAKRIVGLKAAGLSRINLSLYDENKKYIYENLGYINSVFRVHTSMVLLRSMLEDPMKILDYIKFIKESGCLGIRFFIYRPQGSTLMPHEIIFEQNEKYISFKREVDAMFPGFSLWPEPVMHNQKYVKRCSQLWQRLETDMVGNVGICCGTDATLQGDGSKLFDATPDQIYNHKQFRALRKMLLNDGPPPSICKGCNLLSDPGW